jgi:GNAT superfamily N-acetyltransferase
LIVRHADQDVGCLILADHPRYENMELVYMGVVPEGRGQGWGIEVVRHAQRLARRAGRQRLVLAVDASNQPAIRMYASAGFQAWDQRRVYYRLHPKELVRGEVSEIGGPHFKLTGQATKPESSSTVSDR